ncbi:NAD(P)-binding protein [Mollisia scopiformis]|uniref:NAD(P)-binding protein n=1 Tax=Mollisia scopiformis TaxID=149040 RepID=A0A132BCG6_MOLSC|nr:NAD(P)-binding protein [Mollisia scopiformis]KUJ10122.1 NAD(P)-binding protein [Mollisia scopiformis]
MSQEVALVTGGCGLVGFHIVKALLQDPNFSSIHVVSRNPTKNLLTGVQYHAGSISCGEDVRALFSNIQPTVVFHVASPASEGSSAGFNYFYDANVVGIKLLLEHAMKSQATKFFICALRITPIYGERDNQMIPGL